ncbi:hypothetical protein [Microvirga lotononidis]|uniref:Uncharacterized protein n=1 Tax=Microvirga lotononidis TaxID=864069 RepID=I4YNT7_9HYPH|nr:hypothetical protein [Microvirga lotononidis]EIM25629.1 hypothetical protein MicloDRAFT_00063560 [Microvirga lotononidis]WQO26486.1 hypothetical protein U0023_17570 [Microvirga lotononidis]
MKATDHHPREYEPSMRPIPVSVALLFVVMGINVAATVLSLLA